MTITSILVMLLMGFVATHGFEDVIITCSEQWLRVRIKWRVLGNHPEPQPSELYLGTRCAATGRLMDYFEYFYPLSHCGIKTEVRAWGILIESAVTYEPANSDVCGSLPISCFIQRAFRLTYSKKEKDNGGHGSKKSTGKKSSTSHQVGNSGTHAAGTLRNIPGPQPYYPSRLSMEIDL